MTLSSAGHLRRLGARPRFARDRRPRVAYTTDGGTPIGCRTGTWRNRHWALRVCGSGRPGLGCMGMSEFYGTGDDAESLATIHRALDLGVTLLDTADMYGPFTNEQLVGRAIAGRRDEVVIATKFGNVRDPDDPSKRSINGRPEYVRQACDASLRRLGVDHIDLYYQHRVDREYPDRGDGRGHGASWSPRARCATSGCPRRRRRRSGVHMPCTRSRRCRPSTRSGAAIPRRRSCRRRASSGSASCPTARSVAASSPARCASVDQLEPRRLPPLQPAIPGRQPRGEHPHRRGGRPGGEASRCRRPAQVALAWIYAQGDDTGADPGHQAPHVPGGERRGSATSPSAPASSPDLTRWAIGRRALSGHEPGQRLSRPQRVRPRGS